MVSLLSQQQFLSPITLKKLSNFFKLPCSHVYKGIHDNAYIIRLLQGWNEVIYTIMGLYHDIFDLAISL